MKEDNYYFYRLCLELFDKINEIYDNYNLYTILIGKMLTFLQNENFNDLTDDKKHYFKYISQLVLDKKSLLSKNQLDQIIDYLQGIPVNEDEIINSLKKMKKFQKSNYTHYKLKCGKDSKK